MSTFFGAASSTTRAALDLVPNLYVDVQDYGFVIGSGSPQDAALQDALNAASTGGGGRVLLPKGITVVTSEIQVPQNVVLEGQGRGTSLQINNASTLTGAVLVLMGNSSGVRKLHIDGNKAAAVSGSCSAIRWNGGGYVDNILDELLIENMTGIGLPFGITDKMIARFIKVRACAGIGFYFNAVTNFEGIGLVAEGCSGIGFDIGDGCTNLQLVSPISRLNASSGMRISGRTTKDVEIISPKLYQNTADGLIFNGVDEIEIVGGTVEENGSDGMSFIGSRWNNIVGTKLKNNSQTTNGAASEIQLADDGTTPSQFNSFVGVKTRITAANKASLSFFENGATSGPNYVSGGSMDAGVSGTFLLTANGTRFVGVGKVRDTEDPQTNVSANYTVLSTDYFVRMTTGAGDKIVTLPDPAIGATPARFSVIIFKADSGAGAVKIIVTNGKLINGLTESDLTTQFQSLLLVSNGTGYDAM